MELMQIGARILTSPWFVPLMFFLCNVIAKATAKLPHKSVGADLCLFILSFNFSRIPPRLIAEALEPDRAVEAGYLILVGDLSNAYFVIALVGWFVCLYLLALEASLASVADRDTLSWRHRLGLWCYTRNLHFYTTIGIGLGLAISHLLFASEVLGRAS